MKHSVLTHYTNGQREEKYRENIIDSNGHVIINFDHSSRSYRRNRNLLVLGETTRSRCLPL